MKRNLFHIIIILFFAVILIFPETVFNGACTGLLLWFEIVLPTLLPFLIVSGLLINTPAIHLLVKVTSPAFSRLFHVSDFGSFSVLCGFLCGYPMGGKVTSDLYRSGKISLEEAKYLLSFCNNTSPMFIISFVMHQSLNAAHLIVPAMCILFLSPLLCSFIFRIFYKLDTPKHKLSPTNAFPVNQNYNLLDDCIMKSFETITKIGGYIMLFSILVTLFSSLPVTHSLIDMLFLPFLEITNGVSLLSQSMIPFSDKFVIMLSLVSFGGWCSIAQTKCIVSDSSIPLFPYIIQKLVTTLVTSLLASIFLKIY